MRLKRPLCGMHPSQCTYNTKAWIELNRYQFRWECQSLEKNILINFFSVCLQCNLPKIMHLVYLPCFMFLSSWFMACNWYTWDKKKEAHTHTHTRHISHSHSIDSRHTCNQIDVAAFKLTIINEIGCVRLRIQWLARSFRLCFLVLPHESRKTSICCCNRTCDGAIALIFVLTIVARSHCTHPHSQQLPPPTTNKYRNH